VAIIFPALCSTILNFSRELIGEAKYGVTAGKAHP